MRPLSPQHKHKLPCKRGRHYSVLMHSTLLMLKKCHLVWFGRKKGSAFAVTQTTCLDSGLDWILGGASCLPFKFFNVYCPFKNCAGSPFIPDFYPGIQPGWARKGGQWAWDPSSSIVPGHMPLTLERHLAREGRRAFPMQGTFSSLQEDVGPCGGGSLSESRRHCHCHRHRSSLIMMTHCHNYHINLQPDTGDPLHFHWQIPYWLLFVNKLVQGSVIY